MQRKQQPIVIVDKRRVDFVLHIIRLAVSWRANLRSLYWFAMLILSLKGNLSCLWFPHPRTRKIHTGKLRVPRVSDRFHFSEFIKAIRFGKLFANGGRRLSR